jgi:hypothetical protein
MDGAMWLQRQKQFLLANGIGYVVVNTRSFDGWDIDMPSFQTGEDPAFFQQLSTDLGQVTRQPRSRPVIDALLLLEGLACYK